MFYGDLHFHTHYSDNRDHASVEAMIERGLECGIDIFGTGDHNHNMTAESSRAQMVESEAVRASHPGLILLNNSEITFLGRHFHVFDPGPITGSISEAYGFLYGNHDRLTMANHPGLPSDEWNRRIIPSITAIEVVNGSVLKKTRAQMKRLISIFDLPSIGTYVRYLRLGIPVAVLGNSDAHSLTELGTGFTGFHVDGKPDEHKVLESIRGRTTFASTTTAIDLNWLLDAGRLSWSVELGQGRGRLLRRTRRSPSDDDLRSESVSVEVYNCERLVGQTHLSAPCQSGESKLQAPGLYWISVVSRDHVAVSSPVAFELDGFQVAEQDRHRAEQASALAEREMRSVMVTAAEAIAEREIALSTPTEVVLYSSDDSPTLTDSSGRAVDVRYSVGAASRPIIEKECEPWQFGEFYVWLERNEVHEYRFSAIAYRLEGTTFHFSARLLPYRLDKRLRVDELFCGEVPVIRTLVEHSELCRISVAVPATVEVHLQPGKLRLPISVSDRIAGVSSCIAMLPNSGDTNWLEQFFL